MIRHRELENETASLSRRWFTTALLAVSLAAVSPARAEAPAPLHVAFVGDSMADGLWGAMFRRLGKDKCLAERIKLIRKAKNGTGLTRLDQFNWVDEIGKIEDEFHPDLFVSSFGVNDRQGIVEKDKRAVAYPSPAFDTRYTAIVEDVLRAGLAQGGSMLILGLPVMLDEDADADARAKNRIFEAAAKEVGSDKVSYVQPWTSGAAPEKYEPYLPNAKNSMVLVRAPDGIHFTSAGYDLVLESVYPSILASLKARADATSRRNVRRGSGSGSPLASRREIVFWALVVAAGALAMHQARRIDSAFAVAKPGDADGASIAQLVTRARVGSTSLGADSQRALTLATRLNLAPPRVAVDRSFTVASISPPSGAAKMLRAAMETPTPKAPRAFSALAALSAATGALRASQNAISAYGELAPDLFEERRLTILQLGDSHTAADFFTGHVRDRLQQAFGTGGDAFIVPGKPHVGVRSSLFIADASNDWSYEALQKSDDRKRFHLSGFNALAHHASASLTLKSRNGRAYDHADIDFLQQPGGGRAEVLLDGASAGEVDLDGGAGHQLTFEARAKSADGFRELEVRALDDNAVTVAGVKVGREGDGVSYHSIGYPGATVQLLQRLDNGNLAQDLRELAPDVIVLAFGTNEGFNDNLDVGAYISQYEQIVRRLQALRPGLRIVIIGPADAARPSGQCHAEGVGQHCASTGPVQTASADASGGCRFPVPPKLNLVREAQRKLAERLGAAFWDWSSVQPGPCGAQVWAAANPPLMARDYVHMTLEGYKQSADRFADFLIPLIQGRQTATHVVSND